jgi:hypothetical protein
VKKVFKASMIVKFSYPLNKILKKYEFASSDGISGEVHILDSEQINEQSLKVDVEVLTNRKRRFSNFESYLNLLSTVFNKNKVSVNSLKDIVTTYSIYGMESAMFLEEMGDFKIFVEENDFLLVKDKYLVIQIFETLDEARRKALTL